MPFSPSDLLQNGLSTAAASIQPTTLLNKPVRSLASMTGPGPAPQSILDTSGADATGIFRFPNESLMYYTKITTSKYSRTGWNTIGSTTIGNTVVLPLPMQMIDNQNVKYSTEPLGVSGAIGLGAGIAATQFANVASQIAAMGVKNSLFNGATQTTGMTISAGVNQLTGAGAQLAQGVMAATGYAQNEFLTVMLEGPNYKERDFQWVLSPNSPAETESLRRIIQILNNAQAPTLPGNLLGYAFFQYPLIFNIEFKYKNEQTLGDILFRMRPMVLLNAQYNYTPHGVYAPFTSTMGPNAVEIQLKFLELELWINNSDTDLAYKDGGPTPTALDISVANSIFNAVVNPTPPSGQFNTGGPLP
jgi:hypothetical protein